MSAVATGLIGIAVLIILFLIGTPVGFAMAIVGTVGFCMLVSPEAGLSLLARDVWVTFSNYSLTVIPMFIFMGSLAFATGMSRKLYSSTHKIFGQFKGGLVIATIAACAGFAAICGSTNATAAAMGRVALPEMKRFNYDDSLATGSVAAAGSLGILIPPSTVFMVYGIMTEQSIGSLFLAGIVPGIMLTILFIIVVILMCWKNPALAPAGEATSWKEKFTGLAGMADTIVLFTLVIGGLFLGLFSPMQAGAVGAAGVLILGLIRRQMNLPNFLFAVKDALKITCEVIVIITGAVVFGHFMAVTTIPANLAGWVGGLDLHPAAIMCIIILIYLVGGFFMDALAMITLTIPIIYPLVTALGFNPIWFGVIVVLVTEMGVITPPVGLNVYVIKSITEDVALETIFKGIFPFLAAILVAIGILLAFPQIATFLPNLLH
ncbi:MAG: TRAP transporter large permease [Dehalococcoidales bacterium]|jgi:tripartite ATP-independent transporter DctM subunit|nr:TRAP transporter large permease [Dehalococcoidales bacterium]